MHQSNSSSVSPFQAKTGTPVSAMAAAAWSCVEKMLQLLQVTSAPSSVSVSIRTAVWIVMCRQPAMRAPLSGLRRAVLCAQRHQAGHLVLGERDLLAAPFGELDVGDLVFLRSHDVQFSLRLWRGTMPLATKSLSGWPPPFLPVSTCETTLNCVSTSPARFM